MSIKWVEVSWSSFVNGELYRGSMVECKNIWNCRLKNISFTIKDGKVPQIKRVFSCDNKVTFMVIMDMLKNATIYKHLDTKAKGKGSTFEAVRGLVVAMVAVATLGLHSIVVTAMLLLSFLSASYA